MRIPPLRARIAPPYSHGAVFASWCQHVCIAHGEVSDAPHPMSMSFQCLMRIPPLRARIAPPYSHGMVIASWCQHVCIAHGEVSDALHHISMSFQCLMRTPSRLEIRHCNSCKEVLEIVVNLPLLARLTQSSDMTLPVCRIRLFHSVSVWEYHLN